MINDFAVLELIDRIYEAALDPAQWSVALIQLSDLVQASAPVFMLGGRRKEDILGFFPRTDPLALAAYRDYWGQRDPLYERTTTFPPLEIATPNSIIGRRAFKKTPFYNEWWEPAGMGISALRANLFVDCGIPSGLSVYRQPGADDFTSEEIRLFLFAARHFARAEKIAKLVSLAEIRQDATLAILEGEGKAAILVDDRGRVLLATEGARRELEAGGALRLVDSYVSIADRPGVLEKLIASCASTNGGSVPGGTCFVQGKAGRRLELTVAPFRVSTPEMNPPWLQASRPVAMIGLVDPEIEQRRAAAKWRKIYGLTPAEARVAVQIVRGGGRRTSADRLGISDATVRTHLSNIFAKTGTNRQAELVAILSGVNIRTGQKRHPNGG